jgi:hypothetical protein
MVRWIGSRCGLRAGFGEWTARRYVSGGDGEKRGADDGEYGRAPDYSRSARFFAGKQQKIELKAHPSETLKNGPER